MPAMQLHSLSPKLMFSIQLEVSFLKLQVIVYIACRETGM